MAEVLVLITTVDRVEFVVGPAFTQEAELTRILSTALWESKILKSVPSLLECYRRADFGFIAGGLAMYEVCRVGLPTLLVPQPIDHQIELS